MKKQILQYAARICKEQRYNKFHVKRVLLISFNQIEDEKLQTCGEIKGFLGRVGALDANLETNLDKIFYMKNKNLLIKTIEEFLMKNNIYEEIRNFTIKHYMISSKKFSIESAISLIALSNSLPYLHVCSNLILFTFNRNHFQSRLKLAENLRHKIQRLNFK